MQDETSVVAEDWQICRHEALLVAWEDASFIHVRMAVVKCKFIWKLSWIIVGFLQWVSEVISKAQGLQLWLSGLAHLPSMGGSQLLTVFNLSGEVTLTMQYIRMHLLLKETEHLDIEW